MTGTKAIGGIPSLVERFHERWLEAAGEYIPVAPGVDVGEEVLRFLKDNGIAAVVLAGPPLTSSIGEALAGKVEILADFGRETYDREAAVQRCSNAGAGITGVDTLIAATGTLVLTSRGQGDRLVSSLPPVHLVVATGAPVFNDMETFMQAAPAELSFCFVTGPSRTADIEKQLILGAHGPKRVVVWGPG